MGNKDSAYWENFYKTFEEEKPSLFAEEMIRRSVITPGARVLDAGCGNGRDSLYLARAGAEVLSIDAVVNPCPALNFVQVDMSEYIATNEPLHDVLYARFFFHSIPFKLVRDILTWNTGSLAAEFRIKGDVPTLYRDHKRYMVDPEAFIRSAVKSYNIRYFEISTDFSPYKGEKPLVARIIADKK